MEQYAFPPVTLNVFDSFATDGKLFGTRSLGVTAAERYATDPGFRTGTASSARNTSHASSRVA